MEAGGGNPLARHSRLPWLNEPGTRPDCNRDPLRSGDLLGTGVGALNSY
jgi:hypothetical protein